jgi:DNA-binding NarL/FixJ family response regulator
MTWKVVIAEDHTILREGLRALLGSSPEFEVVAEAEDGKEAIKCVERKKPDIVLMDLSMPRMSGIEAIREIKRGDSQIKVVALTVHKTEEYVLATLKEGVDAYVVKDATHSELLMALRSVIGGKRYLSPGVSDKVIEGYLEGRKTVKPASAFESLTAREREILKLIAEGYKNREIADYLCISVKTVETHRSSLMRKLDIHNVSGLTAFAMDRGLVTR